MKKDGMIEAFKALDAKLTVPLTMVVGGGAAMLLAHGVSLATHDVDGVPLDTHVPPAEVERMVREVAAELKISPHWYNDYFKTFTFALPPNFRERLVEVFKGRFLSVKALGALDLLVMKCMAGREKDIGHARALVRRGADWKEAEAHLDRLAQKGLPGAREAARFLEDLVVEIEDA